MELWLLRSKKSDNKGPPFWSTAHSHQILWFVSCPIFLPSRGNLRQSHAAQWATFIRGSLKIRVCRLSIVNGSIFMVKGLFRLVFVASGLKRR